MDYAKLHKRIDYMLEYESDNFLLNINLKDFVAKKLYDYQQLHVFNLMTAMRNNNVVLDGSDTGTGKTYTAIAICKQMNLKPMIICPKVAMSSWNRVCNEFYIRPLCIVNYETIKTGKCYGEDDERIDCPYVQTVKKVREKKSKKAETPVILEEVTYKWKLPPYSLLIFDEAHKCKNHKSQNGILLASTKCERNVLMLSATISDTPKSFQLFGYMLGLYKHVRNGKGWIEGMIREDKSYIGLNQKMSAMSQNIYPDRGSRMSIKELGDKFPDNQVSAECYKIDAGLRDEVNAAFALLQDDKIQGVAGGQVLGDIQKVRQKLERIKLDNMIELADDYLDNGYSVVVFVNYNKNLQYLANHYGTKCVIHGEQSLEVREGNRLLFQNNESHIIICNIEAGGTAIDLHDLYGRPRVSIISPPMSSVTLTQALGRIHRVGAKSPALQRIVFCSDTCEEIICNKIRNKLQFMATLNDDDLIKI